jgi:cysteine desulfurase
MRSLFNLAHTFNRFSTRKVMYFDYQATTPVDYRVLDAMMPYFTENYGNPHSKTHKFGWDSSTAIEAARKSVADMIGAD